MIENCDNTSLQFVSSLVSDLLSSSESDYEQSDDATVFESDNDKMDRDESLLQYIENPEDKVTPTYSSYNPYSYQISDSSNSPKEHRFSNMYTQDAYYDLPRYLYF